MNWLIFLYAFTLGAEQNDMLTPDLEWYGYSRFEASIMIGKTLEIGGAPTIYFQPAGAAWFAPVEGDFPIFARLHFGIMTVEAEHFCIHGFFGGTAARDGKGYDRLTLTLSNRKP